MKTQLEAIETVAWKRFEFGGAKLAASYLRGWLLRHPLNGNKLAVNGMAEGFEIPLSTLEG